MSDIILIHGAWHGAWCWDKLIPRLQNNCHRVIAPNLPIYSVANKAAPARLKDYVALIIQIIMTHPRKIILVGHSMAGIILSEVAVQIPDRLTCLVYLTAFMLTDQQSMFSVIQQDQDSHILECVTFSDDLKFVTLKQDTASDLFYHDCPADMRHILKNKLLINQPLNPIHTRVQISPAYADMPRFYITCQDDRVISIRAQQRMISAQPCESVYRLNTGHAPFFSAPEILSDILDDIGERCHKGPK